MYVPDEQVLGDPGFFGFLGKAAKKVAGVVGGVLGIQTAKVSVPAPQITIVPTPAAAQSALTGAVQDLPPWVIPGLAVGAAVVLALTLSRRR